MVSFFCKRIMCSLQLETSGTGGGGECSVYIFSYFATPPMSGEGVTVFMIHLLQHIFWLFKTSAGAQTSYCFIIINAEKKEAWFLPYESKPVFFRWMIIKPLGVAGNGPLSPLIQRNTNKHQLHINVKKLSAQSWQGFESRFPASYLSTIQAICRLG